jgi:hypothetical protein
VGWWRNRGGRLVVAALAFALVGAIVVVFAPLWSWEDSTGATGSSSAASEGDTGVIVVAGVPSMLVLFAVLALGTRVDGLVRWVTGVLLFAFCFLAGFSIGLFFLPAAGALLAAAVVRGEAADHRATHRGAARG